jgi:small subunit ribosomal protein MRP21
MEKPFSWPSRDQQYPDSYKPPLRNYKEYNSDRLLFPDNGLGSSDVDATLPKQRVLTELPIHLTPRTGRSIDVDPGKNNDLGTRMRQLDMLCARNQIRSDFAKQRFHERGGMKRKRLKSQRWRIRFKNEFRKTVLRVQQLRKKGW